MSLDRIDARFLLPRSPATAVVLGDLPHWRAGLEQANVRVLRRGERADLSVATREHAREAAAGAAMTIVEGGRGLPGARAFVALPRPDRARLFVPLGAWSATQYALRRFELPVERLKRVRNAIAATAFASGITPARLLANVAGEGHPPYLLERARQLGDWSADANWFLVAGSGDVFSRGVFLVLPVGDGVPRYALKFSRVAGHSASFDRDQHGLELVQRAGTLVSTHAPRLLGRFEEQGSACSLETAAVGERLFAAIDALSIERIAAWLVDVEASTRGSSHQLEPQRREAERLAQEWSLDTGSLTLPPDLPSVLQHNDLGTWNVVVDRDDFTVLDWEDAIEHGFPLVDLWYFLADAIAHLDGVAPAERTEHFVRLFRGELESSRVVFEWTKRAVERLGIRPDAVGSLATVGWLRHGSADRERRRASAQVPGSTQAPVDFAAFTTSWLAQPGLGPGWDQWRT